MQLPVWNAELLIQSKLLELQLPNAKTNKDEILFKRREQELRAKEATPLSNAH